MSGFKWTFKKVVWLLIVSPLFISLGITGEKIMPFIDTVYFRTSFSIIGLFLIWLYYRPLARLDKIAKLFDEGQKLVKTRFKSDFIFLNIFEKKVNNWIVRVEKVLSHKYLVMFKNDVSFKPIQTERNYTIEFRNFLVILNRLKHKLNNLYKIVEEYKI